MIKTYGTKKLKYPYEKADGGIIILDNLNEEEIENPRIQATFKRSRHNIYSIFRISQDYYHQLKRTIRANGNK